MFRYWWRMEGPKRFITEIANDLCEGRNLVLLFPSGFPNNCYEEVKAELNDVRSHDMHHMDRLDEGAWEYLSRFFSFTHGESRSNNIENLINCEEFKGKIIWINQIGDNAWKSWKEFLINYQQASRSIDYLARTMFCVCLNSKQALYGPDSDVCLSVRKFTGYVDYYDSLSFALWLLRERGLTKTYRYLLSSIIANLSLWDPFLAVVLSKENFRDFDEIYLLLKDNGKQRNWDNYGNISNDTAWSLGMRDIYDGKMFEHSCVLALRNDNNEISRRIWKAQVSVLYPLIEEKRQMLISNLAKFLKLPHFKSNGERIDDLMDLEIGHIEYQLFSMNGAQYSNKQTREIITLLKDMRNSLSHLEVFPIDRLLSNQGVLS